MNNNVKKNNKILEFKHNLNVSNNVYLFISFTPDYQNCFFAIC